MATVAIPALACARYVSVSRAPSKVRLTCAPVWPLYLALPPELRALLKLGQVPLKITALSLSSYDPGPTVGRYVNCVVALGLLATPPTETLTSTVPVPGGLMAVQVCVVPHVTP